MKRKCSKRTGFTLVELVVVITILAVLWTISFLAVKGYGESARNSTILTNLQSVASALTQSVARDGTSYRKFVSHDASFVFSTGSVWSGQVLSWAIFGTANTNLSVGQLNQNLIGSMNLSSGIDKDDKGNSYIIGAVDFSNLIYAPPKGQSAFQIAATIYEDGKNKAIVVGNYVPSTASGDIAGLVKSPVAYVPDSPVVDGSTTAVPYVYAGNLPLPTDPLYASVTLLEHFDSASFPDQKGHATTVYGSTTMSTTQKKFGAWSAYFDGTAGYTYARLWNTDSLFWTGAFTIEFFTKVVGAGQQVLFGQWNYDHGLVLYYAGSNQVNFGYFDAGWNETTSSYVSAVADGNWHHLAMVRDEWGASLRMYEDGILKATKVIPASFTFWNTSGVGEYRAGSDNVGNRRLNGYMDELRMTKWIARYTTNFTIPSMAFPDQ